MSNGLPEDSEQFLEAERRRLYEEIRNYPTPIAGCDQQFNHLLEQQARIIAKLHQIRAPLADEPAS
ncbi:MAG: hypothetical protein WD845_17985 [Pirellulales bacterium]